ncbi:MAG: bifunctional adenosylcobinamide kinase/adenosylcobinamide-phosphate guanylyltransferase [Chloroflexota bacterium]|nr:bifunctional adenosylcobinamide kinase/adenosylcobinamide-phosphate guanylyltransferase [Dehalococcoidia bacterium]MDW8252674.1 bifunctional adenosylcobinamide kinase/adenosylcobinamide-phosphate guanylyltransferase [Chloroflexota bacterium]
MTLTLILGGVRSGKSAYAEQLIAGPAVYVATLRADDEESRLRIERHRARRPAHWRTVEAVDQIAKRVAAEPDGTVLLDGFGLVVGAALETAAPAQRVAAEVAGIVEASRHRDWIVVSEEVGLSLVAPTPLGRQFQDLLGEANQALARAARRVVLVVAGRTVELA